MPNIVDYVRANRSSFSQMPVNQVDSLVFCQIAYWRIGETFHDAIMPEGRLLRDFFQAEHLDSLFGGLRDPEQNNELVAALAASPRFREVVACLYVNDVDSAQEKQFSAVCFKLPGAAPAAGEAFADGVAFAEGELSGSTAGRGEALFAAFRGTDSSLAGWREDFNLAIEYPIPAQTEAVRFLKRCAVFSGPLYAGGHSKGGNLATYAALSCGHPVSDRVLAVFDHDGPGFSEQVVSSPEFKALEGRVRKTVPQQSVVGMLFDTVADYQVVKSSGVGILQHDPYTWQVDVSACDFSETEHISSSAQRNKRTLDEWIDSMDDEERSQFIAAAFEVLGAGGSSTVNLGNPQAAASAAGAFLRSDAQTRSALVNTLGAFVRAAAGSQESDDSQAPAQESAGKQTGVQDAAEDFASSAADVGSDSGASSASGAEDGSFKVIRGGKRKIPAAAARSGVSTAADAATSAKRAARDRAGDTPEDIANEITLAAARMMARAQENYRRANAGKNPLIEPRLKKDEDKNPQGSKDLATQDGAGSQDGAHAATQNESAAHNSANPREGERFHTGGSNEDEGDN